MSVRLLALVGSLRHGSYNRQIAEAAVHHAPDNVEVTIFDGLGDVPFYNEDIDVEGSVPAAAVKLREAADAAQGLLLVTPEYNGTMPAVLKNAIDWLSRPYGSGAIKDKPVAVLGTSVSGFGAKWAHEATAKSAGIAGGAVLEEASLSVPNAGRFAEVHPKDDAEIAQQLPTLLGTLAKAA
jgi:NAD(P)H-dependent FMN reductase